MEFSDLTSSHVSLSWSLLLTLCLHIECLLYFEQSVSSYSLGIIFSWIIKRRYTTRCHQVILVKAHRASWVLYLVWLIYRFLGIGRGALSIQCLLKRIVLVRGWTSMWLILRSHFGWELTLLISSKIFESILKSSLIVHLSVLLLINLEWFIQVLLLVSLGSLSFLNPVRLIFYNVCQKKLKANNHMLCQNNY